MTTSGGEHRLEAGMRIKAGNIFSNNLAVWSTPHKEPSP